MCYVSVNVRECILSSGERERERKTCAKRYNNILLIHMNKITFSCCLIRSTLHITVAHKLNFNEICSKIKDKVFSINCSHLLLTCLINTILNQINYKVNIFCMIHHWDIWNSLFFQKLITYLGNSNLLLIIIHVPICLLSFFFYLS